MRSRRTTDACARENSQTPSPRLPILAVTVTAPPRIPRAVASLIQGHFDCPWQTGGISIAKPSRIVRELRMFFPPQILGASMSRVRKNSFTTLRFPLVAKAILQSRRVTGAAEKRAPF